MEEEEANLVEYERQLAEVTALLRDKPDDAEALAMKEELEEIIEVRLSPAVSRRCVLRTSLTFFFRSS